MRPGKVTPFGLTGGRREAGQAGPETAWPARPWVICWLRGGVAVRGVRFPLGTGHPETRQWSGEGCPGAPYLELPRAVP